MSDLTCSYTHSNSSFANGEPVLKITRNFDKSWLDFNSSRRRQVDKNLGLVPKCVMPQSATISQRRFNDGRAGNPSNSVMLAPAYRPASIQFHIIQPVVVTYRRLSSTRRSQCSSSSFVCCKSVPPAPCTIHFGGPLVPELYIITNGCSNGNRSNTSSAGSLLTQ